MNAIDESPLTTHNSQPTTPIPERIYKLQPNRTIQLRGFNDLGAAAALHSATDSAFTVSGVFRDPADFCVLTLYDCDNFFEHPSLRYLPDTDFDGLTLTFDVRYQGLRTLDSPRWRIIDWPFLDVIRPDSTIANVPLFEGAELVSGAWTPASARFQIVEDRPRMWDRLSIWYLNKAFDYLVTDPVETAYAFTNQGAGATYSITVEGVVYAYTQPGPEFDLTVTRLQEALSLCPHVTADRIWDQLDIRVKPGNGELITISSSSNPEPRTLRRISAASIAADLARQCNETPWTAVGADIPITAEADGAAITFTAAKPGEDGNALSMYAVSKNSRLTTEQDFVAFTGGSSDATWRVSIDFRERGIAQVRKMWLTFAPPISNGKPFEPLEWSATFSGWTVEGPEETRRLRVAGPSSFRIEETSSACVYSGTWNDEHGFYSSAYAKVATAADSAVTIGYDSGTAHELWIGTSLYSDRGAAALLIDGVPHPTCDTRLDTGNDPAVITRRKLAGPLPPGRHVVTLRTIGADPFYFDYLDIVVPSDVPDNLPARTNISPALDYSTDHTYKLPPARILWMFDKLGFAGPMNEYIGVFWWNQRKRSATARIPRAVVTFTGVWKDGDMAELRIAGTAVRKTVLSTDTPATIARHFACYINATFVGLWAAWSENTLTLTSHSPTANFHFDFTTSVVLGPESSGGIDVDGSLRYTGEDYCAGDWIVDPTQTPALNRGARDWHTDFFRECQARGRELVVAASMELVMPPPDFPARYGNGEMVKTDVGYGSNWWSSHCAFNHSMLAFHKQVFSDIADLMAGAGLTPDVQFGEFCWWYFPSSPNGTMALYDDDTNAAALAQLGRPLAVFATADDDPSVNGAADATLLRNRLRDYVAALVSHVRAGHPNARFEVLFPYDVNYPRPAGKRGLGGRLLRFINFPAEWENPQTAGFDRLKMEGLDWGALTRDLDLVRDVLQFPLQLGWPAESVRYMAPIFNGGCPWRHEYRLALRAGIPVINLWAFDHVCIFGLPVVEPVRARSFRF